MSDKKRDIVIKTIVALVVVLVAAQVWTFIMIEEMGSMLRDTHERIIRIASKD